MRLVVCSIVSSIVALGAIIPAATPIVRAGTPATWTSAGPFGDDATAVAVSPNFDTDHTVFLGVSFNNDVGNPAGQPPENATAEILQSTDGGATWSSAWRHDTPASTTSADLFARLTQIVVSPSFTTDHTVFALWMENGVGGVVRSTDGGQTFADAGSGLPTSNLKLGAVSNTLAISPTYGTDTTIAVTANGGTTTSSYLSTNGGSTWSAITVAGTLGGCQVSGGGFLLPLGNGTLASYMNPSNPTCNNLHGMLYVTSTDGGSTWNPPNATTSDIQAAVGTHNFDSQHSRLYATPDGTNIIYTDQYGNAVRSGDGGQTWRSVLGATLGSYSPPGASGQPTFIFDVAPGSAGIYTLPQWASAAPHLYHSADGGATWSTTWAGHGVTALNDVAVSAAGTIFYAAGNEGLLRSTDGATTWQSMGSWLPQFSSVAVSPNYASDGTVFTGSYRSGMVYTQGQDSNGFGIFRSNNSGASWHEPEATDPETSVSFDDVFTTGIQGVESLAVSPNFASDHTVFEGDTKGTVRISHDGGATWTNSIISNQVGWYINALAVSPNFATDRVVFAALGNQGFGIVRSNDGGATWMQDVPADQINPITDAQTHDVAVTLDPSGLLDVAIVIGGSLFLEQESGSNSTPAEWYSITQGLNGKPMHVAFSPNYSRDCTIYVGVGAGGQVLGNTIYDGLYVSHNACFANAQAGTVTWTRLTNGLPAQDISAIAISRNFASDHTLFVGSQTQGVFQSTDNGDSWTQLNSGLGDLTVRGLSIASSPTGAPSVLYAATDGGVWQINPPQALTVTVTDGPGWNLMGGYPLTLWSGSQVNWTWNAATGQWSHPAGFEPAGSGAWEELTSTQSQSVSVEQCAGPVSIPVTGYRWNMVGNPCSTAVSLPAGIKAYRWDPATGAYLTASTIGIGAGVWVKPAGSTLILTPGATGSPRTQLPTGPRSKFRRASLPPYPMAIHAPLHGAVRHHSVS